MSDIEIKYNGANLEKLIKLFKEIPMVKVGIMGNSARNEEGLSNAEVGAAHEFGTSKLPQRSFLRYPLTEKLGEYLGNAGAFEENAIEEVIKEKSFESFMIKVGLVGENVVRDAFGSNGFGKWKPSNMKYKKNHETLVETNQLRDSISSEVES